MLLQKNSLELMLRGEGERGPWSLCEEVERGGGGGRERVREAVKRENGRGLYIREPYTLAHLLERLWSNRIRLLFIVGNRLLTLGAHAQRRLQYLVCHSVCPSFRLSVCYHVFSRYA